MNETIYPDRIVYEWADGYTFTLYREPWWLRDWSILDV